MHGFFLYFKLKLAKLICIVYLHIICIISFLCLGNRLNLNLFMFEHDWNLTCLLIIHSLLLKFEHSLHDPFLWLNKSLLSIIQDALRLGIDLCIVNHSFVCINSLHLCTIVSHDDDSTIAYNFLYFDECILYWITLPIHATFPKNVHTIMYDTFTNWCKKSLHSTIHDPKKKFSIPYLDSFKDTCPSLCKIFGMNFIH